MPAKNAPSAKLTPKSWADPYAMLTAAATTHSVNSSREPVRVTCHSTHGKTRRPTMSISATKVATSSSVIPSAIPRSRPDSALPGASAVASGGSSTSTSTIARSSTTSHPTAMRPLTDSSMPLLSSARSSTTVLATESARPNTIAPASAQPHQVATPTPSAVAIAICTMAPGSAILRTDNKSCSEKCRPIAEHQQHHADLGKLACNLDIGDKTRRTRADDDAGREVAHQRRHLQARSDEAEHERQPEGCSNRRD